MLQNSPFLLHKLKMAGGNKFEVDYKMDAEQGLQVQSTTFDPFTNTVNESKVEALQELVAGYVPHVAYFIGSGIPTDLLFNYLIEVEGASIPEVPNMERYGEITASEAENPFFQKFTARDFKCFERLFNRIVVTSVEMDAFQQTLKLGGSFYPHAATNISMAFSIQINIKDEFPGQKSTGYVFYQELRRITTEVQTLLCDLVNDSLSSQKRQLDLFGSGEYSNGYFDEPASSATDYENGGTGNFNIHDDIEDAATVLAAQHEQVG